MIVVFDKDYLRNLYETGMSDDKKHRFQTGIIRSYKRGIDYLKWAERKEDPFKINSLHFKALTGDKNGLFSIRAGREYRIEFEIKDIFEETIITICNILELSNHYD